MFSHSKYIGLFFWNMCKSERKNPFSTSFLSLKPWIGQFFNFTSIVGWQVCHKIDVQRVTVSTLFLDVYGCPVVWNDDACAPVWWALIIVRAYSGCKRPGIVEWRLSSGISRLSSQAPEISEEVQSRDRNLIWAPVFSLSFLGLTYVDFRMSTQNRRKVTWYSICMQGENH